MEWLITALGVAARLAEAGMQVAPYLTKLQTVAKEKRDPTQAELEELEAMEADLDKQLLNAEPEGGQ